MSSVLPAPFPQIRVGVVGLGMGSAPHFKALQDLAPDVEVAWVHARDPKRLAAARIPEGAQKTTRLADMLEDPLVKAVLVLTPPNTHLDIVEQAARAGKHVLVEKPLEASFEKAQAMVAVCEKHSVQLGVMLQHRMRQGARALSALQQSGQLGELLSAHASVRWWRPQSYYDEPGRGTLARDGGGVLMTQAIHTLDLMLSFTGMPEFVLGLTRTSPLHDMECEDLAAALLQFPGGAVGTLQASTAANPGYAERIELDFTLGTATLLGGALAVHFANGKTMDAGEPRNAGGGANAMDFDHAAHRAVLQDFLAAVQKGATPRVTGRSALNVHRLIQAITDSSATQFPVLLNAPRA
jgi:UDP-N-acetyl-2-amino-2-deoxyglucuronate dehydrogenase